MAKQKVNCAAGKREAGPDHALLSASSSHMWLACPPSARLCAGKPDQVSPYALEGTCAHRLCEYKVQKALGRRKRDPTESLSFYNNEMEDCANDYCSYVLEQLQEAKTRCRDPKVLVEQRLDFSTWVPEGFGTGDCVIVSDQILHVIDFKYGLGVIVDADHNSQMMCYGLGALETYDGIYDIKTVRMTIFQPRRGNVSTFELPKEELLQWAQDVLAPTARIAYEGGGQFKAGDHCRFCRVKESCRKRAEYNLELARYDFAMPPMLDETEIAAVLERLDDLTAWAADIREYALQQALSGAQYPGFKIVEGRSNRKYTDEAAVAAAVEKAGYDPYEKKLRGITAMTTLLGRKRFNDLLDGLVVKPAGKPALVPESDKRPAMNTAADDIKEE